MISSKRAKYMALASLILSGVFFTIALLVGLWSKFFAVYAISWQILAAVSIWLVLSLQFHHRSLAEQEKLDMSQLAKGEGAANIFQGEGERASVFAVAQRRLRIFEKWFIPIFSAIIAAYQLGIGLYLLAEMGAEVEAESKQPLVCAVSMTAIAFVSFLMSRYATGMSAEPQWKPLRAGGSFLLGAAVSCFALGIGLALVQFKILLVLNVINWAIPILLLVLGAETALNVVLDIYRPRLKGQYPRSAFDSRLLGLINEPGGLLRTAASAIDYQFGFEVSQTWFYKLLEKAIVSLVLFAFVTLYLLSCIVVVGPNEEAIIEHFGNPAGEANNVRTVGPGLVFKWPWPIDIAYKYPTKKISELSIGFVPKYKPGTKEPDRKPLLWGERHHEQEHLLLVASESQQAGTGAVPVSLVVAAVPVQYRIKDLYSFIYNHSEPEKLLEAICYQELTKFAASARIEVEGTGDESGTNESLLGAGRAQAKRILTERIQESADRAGLGVEIVFLGLQGVHPPPELAADYQKVIGAVQKKQALVLGAHAERNKTLTNLAGSVEDADKLYRLTAEYQEAKKKNNSGEVKRLAHHLDVAFALAKGEIFSALRQAQSYAFERATLARASGERFASQLKAYRAATEFYTREQRLAAFEGALDKIRKYVVVADANDTQTSIINLEEKLTTGLLDTYLPGSEEDSEK